MEGPTVFLEFLNVNNCELRAHPKCAKFVNKCVRLAPGLYHLLIVFVCVSVYCLQLLCFVQWFLVLLFVLLLYLVVCLCVLLYLLCLFNVLLSACLVFCFYAYVLNQAVDPN